MKLATKTTLSLLFLALDLFSEDTNNISEKLLQSLNKRVIVLKKNSSSVIEECIYCGETNCYKLNCPGVISPLALCLSCIEETQQEETACQNCSRKKCPFNGYLSGENKIAIDRRESGIEALFSNNQISCDSFLYSSFIEEFFLVSENQKIELVILKLNLNSEEVEALRNFGFKRNFEKPEIWQRSLAKQ